MGDRFAAASADTASTEAMDIDIDRMSLPSGSIIPDTLLAICSGSITPSPSLGDTCSTPGTTPRPQQPSRLVCTPHFQSHRGFDLVTPSGDGYAARPPAMILSAMRGGEGARLSGRSHRRDAPSASTLARRPLSRRLLCPRRISRIRPPRRRRRSTSPSKIAFREPPGLLQRGIQDVDLSSTTQRDDMALQTTTQQGSSAGPPARAPRFHVA